MVYEICAGISTLVFIVIAYYLIKTLISLQRSLKEINEITKTLETKMEPLSEETITLIHHSSHLTKSVAEKVDALDPLFKTISHLGSMAEHATCSINEKIDQERKKKQWKLDDIIELATLGLLLWQQIKKGDKYGKN